MLTKKKIEISVVVPFYKGNSYLERLIKSVINVAKQNKEYASFEIIIVNDSPEVEVLVPILENDIVPINVYNNDVNCGIQKTRVNGLDLANGNWILFLDQDDELIEDGFRNQVLLTENADVVVGNGEYRLGTVCKKIYKNKKIMNYLVREDIFLKIRNLIPSPGECLIRKDVIPKIWKEELLSINGADDWFLWILLFKSGCKFCCNEQGVYIHHDTNGENLSSDLNKMKESCFEFIEVLNKRKVLNRSELRKLRHAVEFKYYQDTKQLTVFRLLSFCDSLLFNIKYRLTVDYLAKFEIE